MEKITLKLWSPTQAAKDLPGVWAWIKAMLIAGHRLALEVRPETRSDQQNKLLHALIGDVSKQKDWMGKKLPPEAWKVLFVSGHSVATKQGAELVPGLEGEFCNIRESTARMGKARLNSLVEYILAWCALNGVELREARQWVDAETGEVLHA